MQSDDFEQAFGDFLDRREYEVCFPKEDHIRLHDALAQRLGYVMVSYNYCPYICELYQDFYIFYTKRANSMSNIAGSEYEEIIMTNYDPRIHAGDQSIQMTMFQLYGKEEDADRYTLIHEPKIELRKQNLDRSNSL